MHLAALGTVAVLWVLLRAALVWAGGEVGEGVRARIDGHDVAMIVFRGPVPSKTLVVALHGGLASKESLLPVCWEARARGADCVVVDALGHGASSELPRTDLVAAMRRALRAERALAGYDDVRFVGHSMGAFLGAGAVYPCARSIAIGQAVACGPSRIVWGAVHRALGLSDAYYVPVSHVLEPWTPSVVDETMTRLLPMQRPAPARARVGLTVGLAWTSFAVMSVLGLLAARRLRAGSMPPALRGVAAAVVLWSALALGAWRTLWFLLPTKASDALVIGAVLAIAVAASAGARALGARSPVLGVTLAWAISQGLALMIWREVELPMIGGLLVLPPLLGFPLVLLVVAWERLSRGARGDVVESAAFSAAILGGFLALLVPSWS